MSAEDSLYAPLTDVEEEVLGAAEIERRASRAPDFEAENRALTAIAQEMSNSPATVLRRLAECVLELCRAGSAGVSLLEPGGERGIFRWHAITGELSPYQGGMMLWEESACAIVIERDEVLLFSQPERTFPALRGIEPLIREVLLAPFSLHGKPVGTVWAIAHNPERQFDAEHARVLASLARFASAAHQVIHGLEAEQALRASEQSRLLAVETAAIGDWKFDFATGMLELSPRAQQMYGRRTGEVIGLDEHDRLIHPEDRAAVQAAREVAQNPEAGHYRVEFRLLFEDGEIRWFESVGRGLFEEREGQCRPVQIIGVMIDITDRKHTEQRLRESDRRKDEFLATLAHELRNPLAPIRNGLEVLKLSASGDERLRRVGQMMERQMSHLVRLVDDLLEVNRISRGKLELRKERLLLNEVLAGVIESNRPQLDAKRLELLVGGEERIVLEGDRDRLSQVFSNLLSNAARYTEAGGRIWVTAWREGDDAVVAVKDTGCGIPAEALESVFEMFTQGHSQQASGGLGIGLALVRQLVQLHGGSVTARSEGAGRGSTFTVRLPLGAGARTEARPGAARAVPVSGPARRARRILVVDDQADVASSLAMVLELRGHEVRTAYGGPAALQAFEDFGPEIVLLDIGMPDMNGHEVARRIRAMPHGGSVRLFALTGWGQDEDKLRTQEAGFDKHLTKPVEPALLDALING